MMQRKCLEVLGSNYLKKFYGEMSRRALLPVWKIKFVVLIISKRNLVFERRIVIKKKENVLILWMKWLNGKVNGKYRGTLQIAKTCVSTEKLPLLLLSTLTASSHSLTLQRQTISTYSSSLKGEEKYYCSW